MSATTVGKYVGSRLLQAAGVIWGVYTLVFIAVSALPSDPATIVTAQDGGGDPAQIAQIRAFYGYDRPVVVQYLIQLGNLLRGDFGYSISTGQTVLERIGSVVGSTIQLASTALLIATLIALVSAVVVVVRPQGRLSDIIRGGPSLFSAVPVFWLGIIVLQVFAIQLGWIPLFPDGSAAALLVPAAVLAVPISAPITQLAIDQVDDVAGQGFIRVARAKGCSPLRVFLAHMLRNIAPPVLVVIATTLGGLIAGSVITETVFGRSGLGGVLLKALSTQDVVLVQGLVLLTTVVVVLANLAVDLLQPVLDPRVLKDGGTGRRRIGV